jgi:hypothetical protein
MAHPEAQMRTCASEALQAVVSCTPHMRNAVLVGFATHLAALSDDNVVVRGFTWQQHKG